jgi:Rieske Fe-S protein
MASPTAHLDDDAQRPSRRRVLRGAAAGAALLAVGGLAACGGSDDAPASTGTGTTDPAPSPGGGSSQPAPSADASAGEPDGGGGATPLVVTAAVPVGGGIILDETVVVTQPAEGEYRGFVPICTHQRCPVSGVQDGAIICPCHGSRFSIEDGSVLNGPATEALDAVPVRLDGDWVVQG